jgi:hypothetical protein
MWRRNGQRTRVPAALLGVAALALVGAGTPWKKREQPLKIEEAITDIANISSHPDVRLEGVGLVVGLDNTGRDAPPGWHRERLVDEMQKAGVDKPNQLLTDPRLSMVIVRAKVPTGTTKTDRLDVEIELPPACGTTSLAGGYLIQCRLKEVMIAGGTPREGQELALAQGPVMIGTEAKPNDPKVGRVLGGCRVKNDSPFRLEIKDDRRSIRTSQMLQDVVNRRFHQTEGIKQNGMAKAKTDAYLELRVPHIYHHNHFRYFRVVKLLPLVENPALREARMAAWGQELLDPSKAGIAALRLEGLGVTAIDVLKTGLASPNDQVKFFTAEALAYLNDPSGAEVLGENAIKRPEFRAYALAALSAMDQPAARTKLIRLMDVAEIPVRYGAFNALRTADENDPFLGRVRVLDEPEEEPDSSGSMAVAIAGGLRSRRQPHPDDPFSLYIVDTDGPPLVHIASTKRCEIVVFGRGQKLLTPIVLGTGPLLLNAADGDESLQVSKIGSGRQGDVDEKVQASLDVGDVIRRTANLGAKYPDVVTILQAASRQRNLPGPLVVDAVPSGTPAYTEALLLGKDATKKDEEVGKASVEEPSRPWFLRRFSRALRDEPAEKDQAEKETPDGKEAPAPAPEEGEMKKDDQVTKTKLESPPARPRLLDRLFRRGGS